MRTIIEMARTKNSKNVQTKWKIIIYDNDRIREGYHASIVIINEIYNLSLSRDQAYKLARGLYKKSKKFSHIKLSRVTKDLEPNDKINYPKSKKNILLK